MRKKLVLWVLLMGGIAAISGLLASPEVLDAGVVMECPNGFCDDGPNCHTNMGTTCNKDIIDKGTCDAHNCG